MEDSERAAELASGSGLDVGLHLNFTQPYTQKELASPLAEYQARIAEFLTNNRFAQLFYHPYLRKQFHYVFRAQVEEFAALYGTAPSHYDGHHHMHLCANVLIDGLIPPHQKIRRSFSFVPGEKRFLNRVHSWLVARWVRSRYRSTDFLYSLSYCRQHGCLGSVLNLARAAKVELETHPEEPEDFDWLMGEGLEVLATLEKGTYAAL